MREEAKLMFEFHREISLVCHSRELPKRKFASGKGGEFPIYMDVEKYTFFKCSLKAAL
jgi:hypothetical protein